MRGKQRWWSRSRSTTHPNLVKPLPRPGSVADGAAVTACASESGPSRGCCAAVATLDQENVSTMCQKDGKRWLRPSRCPPFPPFPTTQLSINVMSVKKFFKRTPGAVSMARLRRAFHW